MSDHQFEKNVRQQLEELRFHPDKSVWAAVEKRITGKKQKRRGIIWIPVLLFLIAGGIFIIKNNQQSNTFQTTAPEKVSPKDQPVSRVESPESKQSAVVSLEKTGDIPGVNDQPDPGASDKHDAASHPQKTVTLNPDNEAASGRQQPPHTSATAALKNNSSQKFSATRKGETKIDYTESVTSVFARQRKGVNTAAPKNVTGADENIVTGNKTRSFTHSTVFATIIPNDGNEFASVADLITPTLAATHDSTVAIVTKLWKTTNKDSVAAIATAPPVERKKEKLQWGITLEAGFSNVTEGGLFDVTQKSLVQDVASNSFSSPLPANAVLPMPSDIRPAPAFSAGVFIKRAVSKRIVLSAGLSYSMLQTSIQVGQWTQANWMVLNARGSFDVGEVYHAGTQQQYNNQYHFIELPFEASFRLNKRRQYPIALTTGMIVGRLIKSNALHFDGATRVYYEDNSLFNKTQAGFSGGLNIGFLQRTAHPVTAGPFFHYRATSLMKYAVNGERHLLSFGINMKVLMKK